MIFKTEPADFKKEIDVVGCFVNSGGKFILLHRQPNKVSGGEWGFPAGKIDKGETMSRAMQREIFEETGLQISEDNLKFLGSIFVRNEGHDFGFHMFSTTLPSQMEVVVNPSEHKASAWVSAAEALKMDFIYGLDDCIELFYQEE